MENESDDVSNIHNRFSLTLVNPGSHYFSLAASMGVGLVIVLATYFGYLNLEFNEFWYKITMVLGIMAVMQIMDVKFAKKKEYSKSLHSSLFGNMLWVVTILMGLLSSLVLSKEVSLFFITFGMILFASFRIGLYTTLVYKTLMGRDRAALLGGLMGRYGCGEDGVWEGGGGGGMVEENMTEWCNG